jgi:cysteine desulfurase family protein (TIGR01976 family)
MTQAGTRVPLASVEAIRSRFPALERAAGGSPVAYFDGPGGTQVPRDVVSAMSDYLLNHNANTHWAFPTSLETDAAIARARHAVADFLGAQPDEVAFGANMTTLTFHLARALGRGWGPGDEVVVTELDHQANVAPWSALVQERGITLRTVPLNPKSGQLEWAGFEKLLTSRTRLVALGAASNALGTVNDIPRAAEQTHAAGALLFVDAVHYAAHARLDVAALDCDFLACSAYKFYGPHIGILFGRRTLLQALDVPKLAPAPDTAPERLETGTQNHEGMVGAGAAVEFLASLSAGGPRTERLNRVMTELHGRGQALVERMWEGLHSIPGVTVYGPPPDQPRTPTLSFAVKGHPAAAVAALLAERGIFASHGDFYATTVIERLGQAAEGVVRAGCACYSTEDEVSRLISSVGRIAHR